MWIQQLDQMLLYISTSLTKQAKGTSSNLFAINIERARKCVYVVDG